MISEVEIGDKRIEVQIERGDALAAAAQYRSNHSGKKICL